jgi:hypothetical protein
MRGYERLKWAENEKGNPAEGLQVASGGFQGHKNNALCIPLSCFCDRGVSKLIIISPLFISLFLSLSRNWHKNMING